MAETNPTATPETPPPETKPAEAAPETPQLSPRVQKLVELGFADVKTDDEAFERIVAAYQQKNDIHSQLEAALSELKQAQPTDLPVPTQDAKTGKWTWNPPPLDPTLSAEELQKAKEARQRYFDSFATRFIADPASALDPLLEDKFNQYFEQKFGQVTALQQEQQLQQRIYAENPWLFESDPVTKQPNYGRLSPEGELLNGYFIEAQNDGMSFERAWKYASAMHKAAKAEQSARQTTAAQTAEQINAQKKQELLNRAAGGAPRTGSMPTPADSRSSQRNTRLTPGQRAVQIAGRNGVAVN